MTLKAVGTFNAGNISGLIERIAAGAQRAAKTTADTILQQAQVLVPIDTGALYKSGNVTEEQTPDMACAYVNFDEYYAWYVEFGTVKMDAQPYLRPAMDAAHGVLIDSAVAETKAAIV